MDNDVPWTIESGANSHCFDGCLMDRGECIAFVDGEPILDGDGFEIGFKPSPEARLMAAAQTLHSAMMQAREAMLVALPSVFYAENREIMREAIAAIDKADRLARGEGE